MKRYWSIVVFVLAALSFGILLSNMLRDEANRGGRTQMNISVVLYIDATDRWTPMEQGIRQACAVLGIQTPLVNYAGERDPEAQILSIQREVDAGAQGLIVAASDSAALQTYLAQLSQIMPIVLVETGVDGLPVLGADNEEIGRALAASAGNKQNLVILDENATRESVAARRDALLSALDEEGREYQIWQGGTDAATLAAALDGMGRTTLVALDIETMELAIDAAETARAPVSVYGVGGSEKTVHALDRGIISEMCVPNDFNLGYISLMRLARQMGLDAPSLPTTVEFIIVRQDNLYDPSVERFLFPIIQ